MKHFIYEKADGSTSERYVVPLTDFADSMLAIDLTDSDEKVELESAIVEFQNYIKKQQIEFIKELGLDNRYRRFKKGGVIEL